MNYLILNQLGTPAAPEANAVGKYLTEFLMDAHVMPLPRPFRDVLVKIGIVPRRRHASAEKYRKIWLPQGSPLAVYTEELRFRLQAKLGAEWTVLTGMRYGEPSLARALAQVPESAASVVLLPLYPHHARATVASAVAKVRELTSREVKIIPPFYDRPWYTEALGKKIAAHLRPEDHLLLSYHGLPLTQNLHNGFSYRDQCEETSRRLALYLAASAGFAENRVHTAFQSRVGVQKWLEPSTESSMRRLLAAGVKHLKVACPSFTADCLETLEEIGLELRHEFLAGGGVSFELIPCLNDDVLFVRGLAETVAVVDDF